MGQAASHFILKRSNSWRNNDRQTHWEASPEHLCTCYQPCVYPTRAVYTVYTVCACVRACAYGRACVAWSNRPTTQLSVVTMRLLIGHSIYDQLRLSGQLNDWTITQQRMAAWRDACYSVALGDTRGEKTSKMSIFDYAVSKYSQRSTHEEEPVLFVLWSV